MDSVNTALDHHLARLLGELEAVTALASRVGRPDVAAELLHAQTYTAAARLMVGQLPDHPMPAELRAGEHRSLS